MGIQGFFNYIKRNRNYNREATPAIVEELPAGKVYDFMFFDFQSGIYGVKNELKEYDYLIRLIHYVLFKLSNGLNVLYAAGTATIIKEKIDYIYNKFRQFIDMDLDTLNLPNDNAAIQATCELIMKCFKSKTLDDFINYFIRKTFENTINIIHKHGLANENCYLFFDGVPSVSKLKEQFVRRIEPTITNNIKKKLYDGVVPAADYYDDKEILSLMSDAQSISIGVGTRVVTGLIEKFRRDAPTIHINDLTKYGEAEHQIMRFIEQNGYLAGPNVFKNKSILLSSPDADLILLAFIMYTKEFNIDIFRYEFICEDSFNFEFNQRNPYKEQIDYIIIEQLLRNILRVQGRPFVARDFGNIKDISFLLLILGDDFLPTIPNIDKTNLEAIVSIYMNYIRVPDNRNIVYLRVDKYNINYIGFKKILDSISTIQVREQGVSYDLDTYKFRNLQNTVQRNSGNALTNYNSLKTYYFINNSNPSFDLIFKKFQYYKKGIMINRQADGSLVEVNLITVNKDLFNERSTAAMLKSYCEGCNFILDIYFNNNLQNYYWYYPFEKSPRADEICDYIQREIIDGDPSQVEMNRRFFGIFNYDAYPGRHSLSRGADAMFSYFSRDQYTAFSNSIKDGIFRSIKDRINADRTAKGLAIYDTNEEAFIYENIPLIYACTNVTFFNKCVDYHVDLSNAGDEANKTVLTTDNFRGGYYKKYIKYKQKYLALKNQ
jgi:hypothetical protein